MGDKMNREYFAPGAAAFNYNNVTGGADSASGGSGGSGMECMQLRSPPGPFHYLISEQAKSLVALQELQNEVGALLEFRDLVIETFPNLRSKMAPSTPASTRRGGDWEPGVRVRRKLAAAAGDAARAKPQPSVQDSGFSTETSCGKDAHSSSASASASASRSRPLEDELWALLDVIQRKGLRLRDEAEQLRGELDERHPGDARTAEESFARALSAACGGCAVGAQCTDVARLREERDELLARAAALEAAASTPPRPPLGTLDAPLGTLDAPLGTLDAPLDAPPRAPRVPAPDSRKFAAILRESNPVELQRHLLISTVRNQALSEQLRAAAAQRSLLLDRLERAQDLNEDLKFRLEEKSIELEGTRARLRQLEGGAGVAGVAGGAGGKQRSASADSLRREPHRSMRDMQPLQLPDDEDPPRRRPSRIPLHKGLAPRPPASSSCSVPPRPPSAHSVRSVRSAASARGRARDVSARDVTQAPPPARKAVPVRRPAYDSKRCEAEGAAGEACEGEGAACEGDGAACEGDGAAGEGEGAACEGEGAACEGEGAAAALAEYVSRAARLAPLFPRLGVRARPLPSALPPYAPHNLALELTRSILYEASPRADDALYEASLRADDALWAGRPQQYFESMRYGETDAEEFQDSLAP